MTKPKTKNNGENVFPPCPRTTLRPLREGQGRTDVKMPPRFASKRSLASVHWQTYNYRTCSSQTGMTSVRSVEGAQPRKRLDPCRCVSTRGNCGGDTSGCSVAPTLTDDCIAPGEGGVARQPMPIPSSVCCLWTMGLRNACDLRKTEQNMARSSPMTVTHRCLG